jgi:hypothetical protein
LYTNKNTIFFHGSTVLVGLDILCKFPRSYLDTSVGRTSPEEGSVRPRDFYQTTHDIHKTKSSTSPAGFDATFSAGKLPQTYFLDLTVAGVVLSTLQYI